MTDSKAVELLKNNEERRTAGTYIAVKHLSIIALEKQIPKKPILKHDVSVMHINKGDLPHEIRRMETDNWHCPECDSFVGERVYIIGGEKIHDQKLKDYCSRCGQKIDWSEKK